MRIVTLEEHYLFPDLTARIDPEAIVRRGMPRPGSPEAVLARAEKLDVPIYIHPGYPPRAVHEAYYANLPTQGISDALARAGWGWHQEVAIHVLRLVLSGALDRHRQLKIIIGHMGEGLPA